jgi:hypothetical protein
MTEAAQTAIHNILSKSYLKGKKIIAVSYKSKVLHLTICPTVLLDENRGKVYEFLMESAPVAREVVQELKKRVSFRA